MVEPANKDRALGDRKKTLNSGRGSTAAVQKNFVARKRPTETGGHKSSANVKPVAVAETKRKANGSSSQVTKAAGKPQTRSVVKSSATPNATATSANPKSKTVPVSVPKAELRPAPKFVSKPAVPTSDFKAPANVAPKRTKKTAGKPKATVAAKDEIRTASGSTDARKKSVTFTFVST